MFIYLLICLLITFAALEILIAQGSHSSDQRLLPLVLGLVAVYNFYLLVEYMTQAYGVFKVLKYLLIIQLFYLLFYYVLDFLQIKLPTWINVSIFAFIGISNILVLFDLQGQMAWANTIFGIIVFLILLVFSMATYAILSKSRQHKVNILYKLLYIAFLFPVLGVVYVFIFSTADHYVMPGTLAIFCLVICYLLLTHRFEDTSKYLKENIFNEMDSAIIILDANMQYIDSTYKIKELAKLQQKENGQEFDIPSFSKDLISWYNDKNVRNKPRIFSIANRHYKAEIDSVLSNKRLQGYILYISDITNEMENIQNAQRIASERGEFLANMSHELRSPLHAIIGGIELMTSSEAMSSPNLEIAKNIRSSGYNLLGIVNSILDYSKVENSLIELSSGKYDLHQLLQEQYQTNLVIVDKDKIDFELTIADPLPKFLLGDEVRIRSIFQNLISNSIKYTSEGSIKCIVNCQILENEKARIRFTITDTGIGISEELQKRLFVKYESLSSMGAESTGIGLFLVKYLAELMDGSISVESDGKTGSTFVVEFVQVVDSDQVIMPSVFNKNSLFRNNRSFDAPVTPSYVYPQANVLIVDDMKVNREILRGKMQPWGFNIVEAASGEEAIELVKKQQPDLIFMDQLMPGLTGIETSAEIIRMCNTPIVIVTANISDGVQKAVDSYNLAGLLGKPLDMSRLKEYIESLIPEYLQEIPPVSLNDYTAFGPGDKAYQLTLEAYVEELDELYAQLNDLFKEDKDTFRIKVHGIKGISRQLGRQQLALYAEILEMAMQSEHLAFAEGYIPSFMVELSYIINEAKEELETLAS